MDRHSKDQLNVRVSREAHTTLAKLTKELDRSQAWVVEEALKVYALTLTKKGGRK